MNVLWWHWVVLGFVLMVLELLVPSFFLIWFGASAVCVGLIHLAFPEMALGWQVVSWTVLSVALVVLWFQVFKSQVFKTRVGLSEGEFVGEVALVIRDVRPFERGQIRFQKPVLGAEVWECIADQEIRAGERVKVLSVEGTLVKVGRA